MISTRRLLIRRVAAALIVAAATSGALANLLVDAGFEDPNIAIGDFGQVVGPPFSPGFWGAEQGNKTTAENGLTPLEGTSMLHLSKRSDEQTQAWQAVDLSGFAAFIDSGNAVATFGASYNVPEGAPGKDGPAHALASIMFFDDINGWPDYTLIETSSADLDEDAGSWEPVVVNTAVPVGTRWALVEVHFVNATLTAYGGYVDDTFFTIPEPASLALLATGVFVLLRRR